MCGACRKEGCIINQEQKLAIFNSFRSVDYNRQTLILQGGMNVRDPNFRNDPENNFRTCTVDYSICNEGRKLPVCRKMFMNLYAVSKKRIEILIQKLKAGTNIPQDLRALHHNRPKKIANDILQQIEAHITLFPTYDSHYTRNVNINGGRQILESSLNLSKMYGLFIEQQRRNDDPECEEWIYRDIFTKRFNLRFSAPKQDCCDTCDRFRVRLLAIQDQENLRETQELFDIHRQQGKI